MLSRLEYLKALEETIPTIVLSDSDSTGYRNSVPGMLIQESFSDIWSEYNAAIVNNLLGLRRHIVVLKAWDMVLKCFDENGESRADIFIDFVEPTLFRARDLPSAIREQCHQCAGKMTYLLRSRDETLDEVRRPEHNSSYWRNYHDKNHLECGEYGAFRDCLARLRANESDECSSATQLSRSHGQRHHDIATIVGSERYVPMVWKDDIGLFHGYTVDEVNLDKEIAVIDEQRVFAQKAYSALDAYLDKLLDALIEDLRKRGYSVRRV